MEETHLEPHFVSRTGWLRAAVMGANDGIVSIASLIVGFAGANAAQSDMLLAGVAGTVAGALSMAAGEYVSVSSQADLEKSDLAREARGLEAQPEFERRELAQIYVERGLSPELAEQVATDLMQHDALEAHARDELGISHITINRPFQAAAASALAFTMGAGLPVAPLLLTPTAYTTELVTGVSLAALAILGAVSARTGGAAVILAVVRVTFCGALAMAATAAVGYVFGVAMG